jgi:hypothetical protein
MVRSGAIALMLEHLINAGVKCDSIDELSDKMLDVQASIQSEARVMLSFLNERTAYSESDFNSDNTFLLLLSKTDCDYMRAMNRNSSYYAQQTGERHLAKQKDSQMHGMIGVLHCQFLVEAWRRSLGTLIECDADDTPARQCLSVLRTMSRNNQKFKSFIALSKALIQSALSRAKTVIEVRNRAFEALHAGFQLQEYDPVQAAAHARRMHSLHPHRKRKSTLNVPPPTRSSSNVPNNNNAGQSSASHWDSPTWKQGEGLQLRSQPHNTREKQQQQQQQQVLVYSMDNVHVDEIMRICAGQLKNVHKLMTFVKLFLVREPRVDAGLRDVEGLLSFCMHLSTVKKALDAFVGDEKNGVLAEEVLVQEKRPSMALRRGAEEGKPKPRDLSALYEVCFFPRIMQTLHKLKEQNAEKPLNSRAQLPEDLVEHIKVLMEIESNRQMNRIISEKFPPEKLLADAKQMTPHLNTHSLSGYRDNEEEHEEHPEEQREEKKQKQQQNEKKKLVPTSKDIKHVRAFLCSPEVLFFDDCLDIDSVLREDHELAKLFTVSGVMNPEELVDHLSALNNLDRRFPTMRQLAKAVRKSIHVNGYVEEGVWLMFKDLFTRDETRVKLGNLPIPEITPGGITKLLIGCSGYHRAVNAVTSFLDGYQYSSHDIHGHLTERYGHFVTDRQLVAAVVDKELARRALTYNVSERVAKAIIDAIDATGLFDRVPVEQVPEQVSSEELDNLLFEGHDLDTLLHDIDVLDKVGVHVSSMGELAAAIRWSHRCECHVQPLVRREILLHLRSPKCQLLKKSDNPAWPLLDKHELEALCFVVHQVENERVVDRLIQLNRELHSVLDMDSNPTSKENTVVLCASPEKLLQLLHVRVVHGWAALEGNQDQIASLINVWHGRTR